MTDDVKRNTVLIIEDEDDIRNLVSRVLGLEGYRVFVAETGEDGLRLARDNEISLLILDLRLPGIDGWTVIEEMKRDASLSEVPIVLFTASVNATEWAKAQKLANTCYLAKPVNVADLKRLVKSILSRER